MFIRNFPLSFRRYFSKIKLTIIPKPYPDLNITICNAGCKIGRLSALLFKRNNIFKNIILWDECCDTKELVNSDLSSINTSTQMRSFCGKKYLVEAVSDSRIIYICCNIQTIPGLSPLDLFKSNANAVRQIVLYTSEFNPTAMVVILTPSVTSLVPMAYEEMLKNDCDAGKQIFGVAQNFLQTANAIANILSPGSTFDYKHYVVGGCDKDTCVPVFSHSSSGRILSVPDFSHQPEGKRLKGEKDVVKYFQNAEENVLRSKVAESNVDGLYMSLATAGYKFTMNLAKALAGEPNITDYAFVKQKNPRNNNERYMTCKVKLNEEGLQSSNVPKLCPKEEEHLISIGKQLNAYIHAGEYYITGRDQIPVHRPKIIKTKEELKVEKVEPEPKEDVFCIPRPKPKSIVVKN